jgi:hypothetical protein
MIVIGIQSTLAIYMIVIEIQLRLVMYIYMIVIGIQSTLAIYMIVIVDNHIYY